MKGDKRMLELMLFLSFVISLISMVELIKINKNIKKGD